MKTSSFFTVAAFIQRGVTSLSVKFAVTSHGSRQQTRSGQDTELRYTGEGYAGNLEALLSTYLFVCIPV